MGDFIRYEILIENTGAAAAYLSVRDELPRGFRYQAGSARRDGVHIDDPVINATGEAVTFSAGVLPAGEQTRVTYVAEISSGVETGDAVNRAYVVNGADQPISNTGEALVFVREDLLRSTLTICRACFRRRL